MLEARIRPRGPYSLRISGGLRSDATRIVRGARMRCALDIGGQLELAEAWQGTDGIVSIRAASEPAVDQMRFVLGVDDDHSPFLREFAGDAMLGKTLKTFRGYRPMRLASVAHALLRALCGQLIESRRARNMERRIIGSATPAQAGLHAPPSSAVLAGFAAAELRRMGLHARRAATLVRLCRSVDLERLRGLSTDAAAQRLERERGLGPWSVGVVCLEGLGRPERGLARDLGLVKLCSALRGRRVDAWETDELLEPYGDWAGLASVFLLLGFKNGLLPLPDGRAAALQGVA
jgi:AraC family transcriptional regulator of adaptative response / DNA-3-methyladenine glycosylase II